MENGTFAMDELNNLPKDTVVMLYLQMRESFTLLSEQNQKIQEQSTTIQKQNDQLIRQVEDLKQQVAILTQQRFGKRSETCEIR